MQVHAKLRILSDAAKYDASCASGGAQRHGVPGGLVNTDGSGICHSYTPDGRCVSLLKILFTNFCIYECRYCVNRASSDIARARFTPAEVVDLTLDFYRRNYIEGLFLSSGIIQSPDYTMEQLVAVARSLRIDHRFGGYIHLKTIPGASAELIDEAGRHADRLSVNIELPTAGDLRVLAPDKSVQSITAVMTAVHDRLDDATTERKRTRRAPRFAPAGQSTQMIVGATAASDRTILDTASRLYDAHKLRRVYYSAFSPIPYHDPTLVAAAPPLLREHRLYQADWLMRFYGFSAFELTTESAPALDLARDPKHAWALRHPEFFPVDVNTAPREALLRVPGVGARTVKSILKVRRHHRITIGDLKKLHAVVSRARPFVVAADWIPRAVQRRVTQPSLFDRSLAGAEAEL